MLVNAKKVEVITNKEKFPKILETIQDAGFVEAFYKAEKSEKRSERTPEISELEKKLAELRFSADFLKKFKPKEGNFVTGLIYSFFPPKPGFEAENIKKIIEKGEIDSIIFHCKEKEFLLNKLKSESEKAKEGIAVLKHFDGTYLASGSEGEYIKIKGGYVPKNKSEDFIREIKKADFEVFTEWGKNNGRGLALILAYLKKDERAVASRLKEFNFVSEEIFWHKPAGEELKDRELKIEELEKESQKISFEIKSYTSRFQEIEALIDWYSWELDRLNKDALAERTDYFADLYFWVPEDALPAFEKIVRDVDSQALISELAKENGEDSPVLIRNTEAFKSFELVTKVYGLPRSAEPDPTPYLAPFFALFFAMALSDVGYGLILFALSALVAYRLPKESSHKLFFKLFAIGGFFSIVAGFMMGTVFGTEIASGMRILNPAQDPIGTLFILFIFGIFQLMAGLGVGFYWNLKRGNWKTALSEKAGYIIFLAGILVAFFTGETIYGITAFALMVGFSFIFSSSPKISKRIIGVFGSLWGIVGYLGDTLSYSRILALALATGIIAMVVNMVAMMAVDMIPVVGWFVAIFILVAGHTMNFFLSVLGAFVHSARLQFVEFFSKFMEGGGRALRPFAKQGRYIELIKQ